MAPTVLPGIHESDEIHTAGRNGRTNVQRSDKTSNVREKACLRSIGYDWEVWRCALCIRQIPVHEVIGLEANDDPIHPRSVPDRPRTGSKSGVIGSIRKLTELSVVDFFEHR